MGGWKSALQHHTRAHTLSRILESERASVYRKAVGHVVIMESVESGRFTQPWETWSAFGYGLTWFPETGHLFIWPHPNCIFLTFNNQGYCWIKVFVIKKKCIMYYKAPSDMTVFFFFWVGEKHKIIAMSSQQTEALRKQATSCQSLTVSTCYYVVLHSNPSS